MTKNIGIFWFRQDLRIQDNLALYEIAKECEYIVPIYIYDDNLHIGSASKWWLEKSLNSLNDSLNHKKSKLFYFKGSPEDIILNIISQLNITHIFWNRLYDSYSIKRDSEIKKKLISKKILCKSYRGSVIKEPWNIKNKSGSFFKVFTPFWNSCLDEMHEIKLLDSQIKIKLPNNLNLNNIEIKNIKLFPQKSNWIKMLNECWDPGEKKAIKILNDFKKNSLNNYDEGRDRPDQNFTSKLSPYLHFGEISPERIYKEIFDQKIQKNSSKKKYLAEIGWREFSYNLIYHYPDMQYKPIQQKFSKFPWVKNNKHLNAWKEGVTGIPIVDAGMRQLYKIGWMHNRLRMIVGSFLCKNLLIHWTQGEKWFFDTLVDADIASNSAGWQWIAGCGADAAPYFRIFNPILQSQKFDPNGEYIKEYVPELRNIPLNLIHTPWKMTIDEQKNYKLIIGKNYPKPIIDLGVSRDRALRAFQNLKSETN